MEFLYPDIWINILWHVIDDDLIYASILEYKKMRLVCKQWNKYLKDNKLICRILKKWNLNKPYHKEIIVIKETNIKRFTYWCNRKINLSTSRNKDKKYDIYIDDIIISSYINPSFWETYMVLMPYKKNEYIIYDYNLKIIYIGILKKSIIYDSYQSPYIKLIWIINNNPILLYESDDKKIYIQDENKIQLIPVRCGSVGGLYQGYKYTEPSYPSYKSYYITLDQTIKIDEKYRLGYNISGQPWMLLLKNDDNKTIIEIVNFLTNEIIMSKILDGEYYEKGMCSDYIILHHITHVLILNMNGDILYKIDKPKDTSFDIEINKHYFGEYIYLYHIKKTPSPWWL